MALRFKRSRDLLDVPDGAGRDVVVPSYETPAGVRPKRPKYIVTLVHGTFAADAPWTREESPFVHALDAGFAQRALIRQFIWTGRNSHRARVAAMIGLSRDIHQTSKRYPGAKHIVIGHSHGGTVAAYAAYWSRRVAAVVTLCTPFVGSQNVGTLS
jgi:pimeloyl-ACP methyl ester carboxylesterase